jgi:diguanylate cyclase (GGDEF)-like protein/PAS domain S-box-containing protein
MVKKESKPEKMAPSPLTDRVFRLMFENHAAIMLLIDPQSGTILDANQAAAKFYGYTRSKLRSMLISEINTLPPEQVELDGRKGLNEKQNSFVFSHKLAGGEIRTVEVHSTAIVLKNSRILFSIIHDISERKLLEREVEEKQSQFQEVLENSLDAAYKRDLRSNAYEYFSPVITRISGYTPDEMKSMPLETAVGLMHPEDQAEIERVFAESISSTPGTVHQVDYRFKHKDGQYRWFQDQFIVVQDAQGQPAALIGSVEDVTERRHAREQLSESEKRYRLLAEGAADVIWVMDPQNACFKYISPSVEKLRGYTPDEVLAQPLEDTLTAESLQRVNTLMAARIPDFLAQGGKTISFVDEVSQPHKNGSIVLTEVTSTYLLNDSGDLEIIGVSRDITERKRVDHLLEHTRKNYETFFNSIDDFLFVLDGQGRIIHINNTVTSRLGYSEEELIGQSVLAVHPPERREEAGRIVGEMLAGTAEFCPVPISTKSGEQISVETRVTRGFWNDKPAIFGVTKDISQVKLSEEKFSKAFQSNTALMALSRVDDGTYLDVNDVFLKTLGFTREEVIGSKSSELNLFAHKEQRNKVIEKMKQSGRVKDIEFDVQTKNGSLRNGLFSAEAIFIGKDQCLLTIMLDITERKQMEAALRVSETNLKTIFNAADDSIFLLEADGIVTAVNTIGAERMQLPVEEIIGRKYLDLLPGDVAANRNPMLNRARTSAESVIFEDDRNGRWMLNQIHPILNAAGNVERLAVFSHDLTDRKIMENAYRESEEKHRFLVENSHDIIYTLTADGVFTFVSPAWTSLLGHPVTQVVGRSFQQFIHSDDLTRCLLWLEQAIKTGLRQEGIEYRVQHADGTWYWHTSSAVPLRDKAGAVIGIEGTARDITERKAAEDLLRESEKRFRHVADTVPALVWQAGTDSQCDYFNKGWLEFTGRTLEQEMGNGWTEGIHPDDRHNCLNAYLEAFNLHRAFTVEYRLRHVSGEYHWLFNTGVPRYASEGTFLGYIGSCVDITDIKQLEKELQTQRDFATTIINTMGQGLTVSNAQGRLEFVNLAYARLLGCEAFALIGKHPREVTAQEYHTVLDQQWAHRLSGKTTTYESLLQRADRVTVPVVITGVPRRSAGDGTYLGSIAVVTDQSGQKRIEGELRNAKQALEQALVREQELSHTDELTGINNRRHLFELAGQKVAIAARYKQPLAVMMFDIDHFKQVNDVFGHDIGDRILQGVTQRALAELRNGDVIGRYGGEEFIILLPMTIALQAYPLAERIRLSVADLGVASDKGNVSVTLSIGIVEMIPGSTESVEDLFRRVDKAMYSAKFTGRNRTVILE